MESQLDKKVVLQLNSLWMPIGWLTPREAIISMSGGVNTPPALALDATQDGEGEWTYYNPTSWDDWVKLPSWSAPWSIPTAFKAIRCPTVVVVPNYDEMPVKKKRLSAMGIRERDGSTCQVSGRKLARHEGNVGHIVARAKGGRYDWKNLVWMDKKLNTFQGTRSIREMNWKLLKKPSEPNPTPVVFSITQASHPSQIPFLPHAKES